MPSAPSTSPHPALPVSLYVSGKRVLLVGSGHGADDRAERLEAARAEIHRAEPGEVTAELVRSAFAVMAHDDDPAVNRRIAELARREGRLAYAHDQPELSDFAMPAQVSHGPLKIAISTDGAAPALSRRLREELGRLVAAAAHELDALIAELIDQRRALPRERRGELYQRIARRLRLAGRFELDAKPEA